MENRIEKTVRTIELGVSENSNWSSNTIEFEDDDLCIVISYESRTTWKMERNDGWTAPYGESRLEVRNVEIEGIYHDEMELFFDSDTIEKWELLLEN